MKFKERLLLLLMSQVVGSFCQHSFRKCTKEVSNCPITEELWYKRWNDVPCLGEGLNYTCMMAAGGVLVEACINEYEIRVFDGSRCPYIHSCDGTEPVLALEEKWTLCPEGVFGCPPSDHPVYTVYHMYKYPACIVRNVSELLTATLIEEIVSSPTVITNITKNDHSNRRGNGSDILGIVAGVTIGFVFVLLSIIAFCFLKVVRRRKVRRKKNDNDIKLCNYSQGTYEGSTPLLIDSGHAIPLTKETNLKRPCDSATEEGIVHLTPGHSIPLTGDIHFKRPYIPRDSETEEVTVQVTHEQDKGNIRKLTETVMKINNNKTKTVQLSPLQDRGDQLPLDLLFASVVIIEDHKYDEEGRMSSKQTREVKDQAEIFDKDGEEIKKIYMLGDVARGKTTFCLWLLQNWCNSRRGEFHTTCEREMGKFDFVFLVQFRNVDPNIASVIDMICDDLFRDDTDCHTAVRQVLSSDKYKSLIIMDGLDEWNPNEKTRKQLKYQRMPNIHISSTVSCFISMRPWVFALISELVKIDDSVLEIVGLSESGMKSVIKNVLLHHYELKDDKSKFKEKYNKIVQNLKDENLKSFMQIPLLAVVCVQIWYDEKQLGNSMTCLYAELLNMLIERAYEKHNLQLQQGKTIDCEVPKILTAHENIKNCISLLLQLGKVAYEGLLSDERNLVFEKRKLEKEIGVRELQFALDVGLISQKEAHSLTTKNVSVHFFHKSIQDFLAVIYIVINKDQLVDSFCKHLSNIKVIMQLSNAIMFICYMCPALGNAISQRVVSMTDEDKDICQYRKSPSPLGNNTVEELYKLQVGWYRELQSRQTDIPVTDIPVTDIPMTNVPVTDITVPGFPVTGIPGTDIPVTERPMIFHISDVYLGQHCDIEAVKVTRELLSDNPVDIRSLSMYKVSSVAECGITDTELSGFLCSNHHNSRSLAMINITDKTIHQIYIPSLRYLYLYEVKIDNSDRNGEGCLPFLKGMKSLRVLALYDVNLGDRLLDLSDMTSLRVLELQNVNLDDSRLDLTKLVSLEELRLSDITLSSRGLDLADMTSLLDLRLSRVTLGYRGLNLSDIISLRVLKLENVTLGYRGLDLSGKTSLWKLTLWNVTLGDKGLDLSDTTSLEVLKLSGVILGYRGLDLTNKTSLRKLVLADVNVGKNGLDLSDLKLLCVLELNGVTLSEKGLNLCAEMKQIEMVRLDDKTKLDSHWPQFIKSVLQIRHRLNVELVNTDIDIESMTKIRSCPDFNVTQDGKNKNASYEFDFTRVWPLLH